MEVSEPPSSIIQEKAGAVGVLKRTTRKIWVLDNNITLPKLIPVPQRLYGLQNIKVKRPDDNSMLFKSIRRTGKLGYNSIRVPDGSTPCEYSYASGDFDQDKTHCKGADGNCWHHPTEDCKTTGCQIYQYNKKIEQLERIAGQINTLASKI